MTARRRPWLRPLVVAVIVVGAWTGLTVPDSEGQGFALWELLAIAGLLVLVLTWRGTAWTRRLIAGAGRGRVVVWAALEGAIAGCVLGVLAFLVAQYRVDTGTPNLLGVLVVVPWILVGALVFVLVGLIVTIGRRPAGSAE